MDGHIKAHMDRMPITEQLRNWQGFAGLYLGEVQKSEKALKNIDDNLGIRVSPYIEFIREIVENFRKSVNDESVTNSVKALNAKFMYHRKDVASHIETKIQTVKQSLSEKLGQIGKDIETLKQARDTHIKSIRNAMKLAQQAADNLLGKTGTEFDTAYKTLITNKFTEIKDAVEKFAKEGSDSTDLLKQFGIVNQQVNSEMSTALLADLTKLKEAIDDVDKHVENDKADGIGLVSGELQDLQTAMATLGSKILERITETSAELWVHYENVLEDKIKDLATMFKPLREAIYGEGGTSKNPADKSLGKYIIDLTAAIGGNGDDDDDADEDGKLDKAIKKFHSAAEAEIRNAAKTAIEKALEEFKMDADDNKINVPAMMTLFNSAKTKITNALLLMAGELEKLKKLPTTIEQTGKNAGELMDELKERIDGVKKAIDAIAKPINDAEDAFDSAVEALDGSLVLAQSAANGKLQDLQFDLQARVNKALHDLEDAVQKMYDDQKKAELRALHSSVADQFSNVRSLIDDDMDMGLKGLMGKLKEAFLVYRPYPSGTDLRPFTKKVNQFLTKFFDELLLQTDLTDDRERMDPLTSALSSLLSTMFNKQHFHREVSDKIDALKKALDNFTPTQFHEASPLLNVVKRGVTDLHEQLRKQYVSRYSGKEWNSLQEPEKTNCAQILVTILKTLTHDLRELHERCDKKKGDCRENKISLISKPSVYNPLGAFFKDCGFIVSKLEESYEGELRCHEQMRGGHLFEKLVASLQDVNKILHLPKCVTDKTDNFTVIDLLKCLTTHVGEYYQSCHLGLPKSKKYPCSIRDICVWLSGLPHTAVYNTIQGHCDKMLNQKDEATGAFPNQADKVMKRSLQHLYGTIKKTCHLSHRLLVSIQGNGRGYDHAAYPYACCFENNHGGFYYPGDPSSLLDMLKDMCMRLLRAVSFLYQQCKHTASDGNGWRECQYGYRVGTYHWDCDKSSDDSNTQPNRQPKCQPNSEPNDQPTCLPKSPLQAHLMDGLPGFMPHKFTAVGCQAMCSTCPKGSLVGQCITPMGFADLATAGSITGRGDDLVDVLSTLCKNGGSVLCELVHALQCISPSPPKGLAEMFSYYCNVMQKSYGAVYGHYTQSKDAIDEAVNNSFPFNNFKTLHQSYRNSQLTEKFRDLYCYNGSHNKHLDEGHCDLQSLSPNPTSTKLNECSTANSTCAPYLKALCHDAHHTYPAKHANMYLSWLCRLAWTFWDLLDQLLKAFNNISCQTYGCLCKCGFGKHGVTEEETSQPPKVPTPAKISCSCTSIVECKGPMSVFYQYGFTFGMPKELMGSGSKKTCDNFVKQLNRVLTNGYFKELFDEIDDFIWAIRTPFSYLLLALWSLSLLYLLHIAVVRLDVLRIRSHLRSPSSHRIAAQSLLAAARVKALANVKYFSP
ncbi:hypothetical protein, conserved [Babesia ovata]|uniref:C3H1-type domain-containing protein n=1 Tax=Babesia ovata TaxID=189622 RepID=A0A2H6KK12_9APIC|nr:uncharacterized protein BOVATA_048140 [Babesia ovata]GBE63321.1 hypothetical protein, conserved [Babesia ovata]